MDERMTWLDLVLALALALAGPFLAAAGWRALGIGG